MNKKVILACGYIKEGYGYRKETRNNTHWITKFPGRKVQMYAYYGDREKIYDTGIISVNPEQLEMFINVLITNHE